MGTLIFVCPTTSNPFCPPALKSIDQATKAYRGRRQQSFVHAVIRATCYPAFGLGWTAITRRWVTVTDVVFG